jgi:hypothetical protein
MSTRRDSPTPGTPLPYSTLRRLAVAADVDPRTIQAEMLALRGERTHVRGMAGERVRRVLADHGYLPHEAAQH